MLAILRYHLLQSELLIHFENLLPKIWKYHHRRNCVKIVIVTDVFYKLFYDCSVFSSIGLLKNASYPDISSSLKPTIHTVWKQFFFSKFEMSSQNECINLKGNDCIITERRKMSIGDDIWGLLHFKATRRIVSVVIIAIKHIRDNYYIHINFFLMILSKVLKKFFTVWVDDFVVKDFAFWDVQDNVHRSRDSHVGVQKFRQNSNLKKCW